MKLVRYQIAHNGRNEGDKSVISDHHAKALERDGYVTIIDHPTFPHRAAREFAGLPPPITAPPEGGKRKRP